VRVVVVTSDRGGRDRVVSRKKRMAVIVSGEGAYSCNQVSKKKKVIIGVRDFKMVEKRERKRKGIKKEEVNMREI